jgi:hypothetical protein
MKSSILIASYLLKDILRRWLETPGALLTRGLLATVLALALLWIQAAFIFSAWALEERIERLGVDTLMVVNNRSPDDILMAKPSLDKLLYPLVAEDGALFLRAPFLQARSELGQRPQVFVMNQMQRLALQAQLGELVAEPAILFDLSLPQAVPIQVFVEGMELTAMSAKPPVSMQRMKTFFNTTQVLLLNPASVAFTADRHDREILFMQVGDLDKIPELLDAIQLLLHGEGIGSYQIVSAGDWLEELSELKRQQAMLWRFCIAFGAGLLVLVFGSVAILEYRQNVFIAALIRSFGIPRAVLLMRYAVESLTIIVIAGAAAHVLARLGHETLFRFVGVSEPEAILFMGDVYAVSANSNLWWALFVAAICSCLPIAAAMRRDVGRLLG